MRTKAQIFTSVNATGSMNKKEALTPPSKRDFKETALLLADFGVARTKIDIPAFKHLHELIRWRTSIINSCL